VLKLKITNSDSIKSGELELIDAITGDLDWTTIEKLLRDKHNLGLRDEVEYKNGDIVVHKDEVAYKLEFDVRVTLSVLFNRDGDCLQLSTSSDLEDDDDIPDSPVSISKEMAESKRMETKENISSMASQIADMLTEINDG
jgi:hypothetical protein